MKLIIIIILCLLCNYIYYIYTQKKEHFPGREVSDKIGVYNRVLNTYGEDSGPACLNMEPKIMYLRVPCNQEIRDKYRLQSYKDGYKFFMVRCFQIM